MRREVFSVLTLLCAGSFIIAAAQAPTSQDIPAPGTLAARTAPAPQPTAPAAEPPAPAPDPPAARPLPPTSAPVARPAPAPTPSAPARIVPAQTPIELQLETHLNTNDNKVGDGFAARVTQSVLYNGQTVIPAGAIVEGHVEMIRDTRPAEGTSEIMLRPDLLTMPNGDRYTISADVVQNDPLTGTKINNEGQIEAPRGPIQVDKTHAEIGGGSGLVAGAVLAGAKGALVGGGLGVAAAAGMWLVLHRHVDLNPGSHLTVRLDRAIQLQPHTSAGASAQPPPMP